MNHHPDACREECLRLAMNILDDADAAEQCVTDAEIVENTVISLKRCRVLALERYARNQGTRRDRLAFLDILSELDVCESPAGEVSLNQLSTFINGFLLHKSSKVREVFVCRYFFAETTDEIARHCKMTELKVRKILKRTRKSLGRRLAAENLAPTASALVQAMTHLGDKFILAAHAPYKGIRRILPTVALLCVVVLCVKVYPYLRQVINVNADEQNNGAASPNISDVTDIRKGALTRPKNNAELPSVGDTVRVGNSSATLVSLTETTATLQVVKSDDTPLHLACLQYAGGVLATTEPNYRDGETLLRPSQIKIYVGESTDAESELPHAAGNYTVVVDFSSPKNGQYRMENFLTLYAYEDDGAATCAWLDISLS